MLTCNIQSMTFTLPHVLNWKKHYHTYSAILMHNTKISKPTSHVDLAKIYHDFKLTSYNDLSQTFITNSVLSWCINPRLSCLPLMLTCHIKTIIFTLFFMMTWCKHSSHIRFCLDILNKTSKTTSHVYLARKINDFCFTSHDDMMQIFIIH